MYRGIHEAVPGVALIANAHEQPVNQDDRLSRGLPQDEGDPKACVDVPIVALGGPSIVQEQQQILGGNVRMSVSPLLCAGMLGDARAQVLCVSAHACRRKGAVRPQKGFGG